MLLTNNEDCLRPEIFENTACRVRFFGKPYDFETANKCPSFSREELQKYCAFSDQVHGDRILHVTSPGYFPGVDGFVTNSKNLPLLVKNADCLAAMMYDPKTDSIGAFHAGWRGLAQKIITKGILQMTQMFGVSPESLLVVISPSIHCPEFTDPFSETPEFFHPFIREGNRIDLWALAKKELLNAGIRESNIEMPPVCTHEDPTEKFWSHRRGEIGRNGSLIDLV